MDKKTTSEAAVIKATAKSWDEWFALLEQDKASQLSHKDIALSLVNKYGTSEWWAQSITVEYERFIGRREVGQSCEGDFQAGASKTVSGTIDTVLNAWGDFTADAKEVNKTAYAEAPTISKTEKWRYWRVLLTDDSKVNINITQKAQGKVHISVNHEKLTNSTAVDDWKMFWKGMLKDFAAELI